MYLDKNTSIFFAHHLCVFLPCERVTALPSYGSACTRVNACLKNCCRRAHGISHSVVTVVGGAFVWKPRDDRDFCTITFRTFDTDHLDPEPARGLTAKRRRHLFRTTTREKKFSFRTEKRKGNLSVQRVPATARSKNYTRCTLSSMLLF